jgi:probable HAF family extracellular repeat protein
MTDLGVLSGGTESWAFDISDNGWVTGTGDVTGGDYHAFVWKDGYIDDVHDLMSPNFAWTLRRVCWANSDGDIVGWGVNASSDTRAFLMERAGSGGILESSFFGGGGGGGGGKGAKLSEGAMTLTDAVSHVVGVGDPMIDVPKDDPKEDVPDDPPDGLTAADSVTPPGCAMAPAMLVLLCLTALMASTPRRLNARCSLRWGLRRTGSQRAIDESTRVKRGGEDDRQ